MALYKYDADNIASIYNNQSFSGIIRLKLIAFEGQYTNNNIHLYFEGTVKCAYQYFENEDIKFIPKQNVKKTINGNVIDGEEIGPFFVMKVNGTCIFNTGVSLEDLQGEPYIKVYGLPTNEQHGLVNLMFGGSFVMDIGAIKLMVHNYGRNEQQLNIGDNIAMIV